MNANLAVFDFDGTLADTSATILHTYRLAIEAMKLPARSDALCRATIGLPLKEGFRQLFPDLADGELDRCVAAYHRIFEATRTEFRPKLYPGVEQTLRTLREQGVYLAIASSRNLESLGQLLADNGILQLFSQIIAADNVSRPKPAPDPVLQILRSLHFEADEAIVIGDMPVDIAMGRNAGCRTVGVTYGNSTRAELRAAGADVVIDNFPALLSLSEE